MVAAASRQVGVGWIRCLASSAAVLVERQQTYLLVEYYSAFDADTVLRWAADSLGYLCLPDVKLAEIRCSFDSLKGMSVPGVMQA